jgi:hypothetical protein
MRIAGKVDTSCEHPLKDCAAIEGEYCIVCHHHSSMPNLARRKPARLGPRKARPSMSALLQIDRDGAGYVLVDRESTRGTIVEGEIVGSATWGGTIALHDGDVISVGTSNSPYVFKFRIG